MGGFLPTATAGVCAAFVACLAPCVLVRSAMRSRYWRTATWRGESCVPVAAGRCIASFCRSTYTAATVLVSFICQRRCEVCCKSCVWTWRAVSMLGPKLSSRTASSVDLIVSNSSFGLLTSLAKRRLHASITPIIIAHAILRSTMQHPAPCRYFKQVL